MSRIPRVTGITRITCIPSDGEVLITETVAADAVTPNSFARDAEL
jgi:hypothetical protein